MIKIAAILAVIDVVLFIYLVAFKSACRQKYDKALEELSPIIVIPSLLFLASPLYWGLTLIYIILR